MSRSGKLISLENRSRSWDGRRLSWRSDRIVAGLREEPTRISRFLTLIWVRILAARRVWTPWRLFCGGGRAGAPSGIYQRTRARHCGVEGPLFRSPSGPPFSAQGHSGATSINSCFGGAGYFSRSPIDDSAGRTFPKPVHTVPIAARNSAATFLTDERG
jgi:hypothetical protein